jgi:serine/threonine protein kinase
MKPENILFNAKNEALLADFGLATSLSTTSIKHVDSAGTPRYMAPEQFQGDVSKESDQYGLACIAYELVTGRPPFTDKDFYALGYQHLTEDPIPPSQLNPHLPATLDQVILKAMAKQRTDRYHDVSSFISALLQAANAQSNQLISTSMSTLLAPTGKETASRSQPDPLQPLVTITPQDTNQRHVITSSHPHFSSVTPTNLRGSRQWLLLAIVGLVIGASLLGGMFLLDTRSPTGRTAGSSLTKGTIPSGTVPGSTPLSSTPSPLSSTPTGLTAYQATVQPAARPSMQATVPPAPDPRPGSSPTPTTPPPTPTKQPVTPTAPTTSPTLTVDFANPSGTQIANSYSGSITVTVSGAGGVGPKGWSDAFYEYVYFDGTPLNPPQHTSCYVMFINGAPTDGLVSTIPAYNPNHWYQFTINVPGGILHFSICDHSYSDNHGSLSVMITQNRNSSTTSSSWMSDLSLNSIATGLIAEENKNGKQSRFF